MLRLSEAVRSCTALSTSQDGFPRWLSGKESACQFRRSRSVPGLERAPGEGNGNPLQYSCLGYPMDREAWSATVHGVAKESDVTQQLNNNTMLNYLYVGKTTSQFSEN